MFYLIAGFIIAILGGFAASSMRRLSLMASMVLVLAFFAFPFTRMTGFLSRETISPTLAGLVPVFPLFVLILAAGCAGIASYWLGGRTRGWISLIGALLTLGTVVLWGQQGGELVKLLALNGLMEALTGFIFFALVVGLSWNHRHLRIIGIILAVGLGTASFLWLTSGSGKRYLPNVAGYYKLALLSEAGSEASIIKDFNDNLEALNEQRQGIGLNPLEPIESITGLTGQRIPRKASAEGFRLLSPKETSYGTVAIFLMTGLLLGAGLMQVWRPQLSAKNDSGAAIFLALIFSALLPAFSATNFDLQRLVEGWPFLRDFLNRSWPPNMTALQQVASEMLITIEIALIGTFLAALFAVPLSFLAARNLTQGNRFMRVVFTLTRTFFNVDRGIDTLILALIFVAAVGLGPFAGILAMAIHSIADLGKVYSESIENVDKGPIEALEAVGASGSNVVRWAIVPQVGPLFIAWTLYRFEINFRVSIVLGLVGAGGIGFFIQEKMGSGNYNQMVLAIIAIIIVVNIIDFASSWLRSRLV